MTLKRLAFVAMVLVGTATPVWGQGPAPKGKAAESETVAPAATPLEDDAERILNMRRLLESDRAQRVKLQDELEELETEFEEAAADFERFDQEQTAARARLEEATEDSQRAMLNESLRRLTAARKAKRGAFEMVIDRRRAVQQQIATLSEKIVLEQEYLARLMAGQGGAGTGAPPASEPAGTGAPGQAPPKPEGTTVVLPGVPPISVERAGGAVSPAEDPDPDQLDDDLTAAKKVRQQKQAQLAETKARVKRLDRAIDVFERDLASTREMLKLAERAAKQERDAMDVMERSLDERRAKGEMEEDLRWMVGERDEARVRWEQAQEEVRAQADRIAKSEVTLGRLKKGRAEAAESVGQREAELRSADRKVWFLSSPIAPNRVTRWFTEKGPRVVLTLAVAVGLYLMAKRVLGRALGKVLVRSGRGDSQEREGRAETLRRVFDSTAGVVIVVLGVLTALNQAGVNVTVLLGGAAVIGAAIAFGSQNLIKDYFSGLMILMENQYSVGNVVKVGAITGTVENITLRMTSLRDLEGVLHFIPHSQVLSVSNLTYGWSRIVMDIKVSVAEDPDKVMETVIDVARRLKQDPQFGLQVLGEPEMLGVDQISGAAMVIKLLVKTKPLNRWPVKREMLRRIKKEFDARGIRMA